ncbi:hypothetical protein [Klebsiella michiganensis]|uniref:hypothetical protein n=1 Tax=Klebsiella michiganensis TaxID=1134687 RepID=UPI003EE186FE
MADNINEYRIALQRLIDNESIYLPVGTKISNDSVAVEAGRKKGTIKKSRSVFTDLIAEIKIAALNQKRRVGEPHSTEIKNLKSEIKELKLMLDASLIREVSLINELFEIKKDILRNKK